MVKYEVDLEGELFLDYFFHQKDEEVYSYAYISKIAGGISQIKEVLRKLSENHADITLEFLKNPVSVTCSSYSLIDLHTLIYNKCDDDCSFNCLKKGKVWRITNFLGIDKSRIFRAEENREVVSFSHQPENGRVMLVNDTGNGFINSVMKNDTLDIRFIEKLKDSNLIFLSSNPSLNHLIKDKKEENKFLLQEIDRLNNPEIASKIVYITNVEDLRDSGANIKSFLSWEQISQDIVWHIQYNQNFFYLHQFLLIIIRIDFDGVIIIFPKNNFNSFLFYDSKSIEGTFKSEIPGKMKLSSTLFMTSIAWFYMINKYIVSRSWDNQSLSVKLDENGALTDETENNQCNFFKNLFEYSLAFIRINFIFGYGGQEVSDVSRQMNKNEKLPFHSESGEQKIDSQLIDIQYDRFQLLDQSFERGSTENDNPPFDSCFTGLTRNLKLAVIKIQNLPENCSKREPEWSILCNFRISGKSMGRIAYKILRTGTIIKDKHSKLPVPFPIYYLGRLRSIDRDEIESYQSIRNTFIQFFSSAEKKPLSITVFGPPGAGKSFGIKEIINNIEKQKTTLLTFNLSQFCGYSDLIKAFHKIRDISLEGKTPIVFFDEFDSDLDSQKLGWLKYFLSPMQDGEFFDGEATHPIGKAIFVFAGGIYTNLHEFCSGKKNDPESIIKHKDFFIEAKGSDFLSRLRGYINIIGCNQTKESDEIFKVRRALLLRSILRNKASHLFKGEELLIDEDVIRSFIKVSNYKHEVRSMEAIVDMSNIGNKTRYEVASLPPHHQLELHTDADDFSALTLRNVHYHEKIAQIMKGTKKVLQKKKYKMIIEAEYLGEDPANDENIKKICLSIPDFLKSINCSYKIKSTSKEYSNRPEGQIGKEKIYLKITGDKCIPGNERIYRIFEYFVRKRLNPPLDLFKSMIKVDSVQNTNYNENDVLYAKLKTLLKDDQLNDRILNIITFIELFYPQIPDIFKDEFLIYPL